MKKTIFVNLNFDDFHPEKGQYGDFGGDLNSGVFHKLVSLTDQFPGLTITLFTTPNWIDSPYTTHRYVYWLREKIGIRPVVRPQLDSPFLLSKHPQWCKAVADLVSKKKFEIAVHGYEHFNPNTRVHGQEFAQLAEEETRQRIVLAEAEFAKMNIPIIKAFRPPGWGTNKYLPALLRDMQYEIYAIDSSRAKTSEITECEGMKAIPQNWSIRESKEEAVRLAEETGVVFMKGHLAYEYGTEIIENGITEQFWNTLIDTLSTLSEKYDVHFVSMEEYLHIKGY